MKSSCWLTLWIICFGVAVCPWLRAQAPGQTVSGLPVSAAGPNGGGSEGINSDGYRIQQSIEVGGRFNDTSGSLPMYDTLVNLQSGPRVLSQSISMQSLTHDGLFDSLTASSFGWGGDPNNAARVRISKYKWYLFTGTFQRDQNYFNYDLFANPLNPPTATPVVNVNNSPHAYYNTRRMYDFGLSLFPQRKISLSFDFNRNRMEGPSFSSIHEGTDALLFQPINTTLNGYRFGLTWRVNRHTTATFIENLQFYKGDTNNFLAPFNPVGLAGGGSVEFGLPWFNGNSPCSTPILGGAANPNCNGYFSYSRLQRVRTSIPTEQLSLQSTSIHNLEWNANISYSNADMTTPLSESFNGLITRTGERQITGPGSHTSANWISVLAELGATLHLTDRLRLLDTFRFRNFRIPGTFYLLQASLFNDSAATSSPSLLLPPAIYPAGTPLHTSSSPADLVNESYNRDLGQDLKENELQLQYDFTEKIGAHIGYSYQHTLDHNNWTSIANRDIFFPPLPNRGNCAGLPLNPDGSCTFNGLFDSESDVTEINQHTVLAGLWFRPTEKLRANADAEISYADNFLTRIDPRHQQRYRGQISYTPHPWLNFGANFNLIQARNHTADINYGMHNRNAGVNAILAPNDRFSFDLAYNFSAYLQNANVCYVGTFTAAGSFSCVNDNTLMEVLGNYTNHTHFGEFSLMLKPVSRVAARVGYSITDVDGSTLVLNPLQPLGPLVSRFQQPLATLDITLARRLTGHAGWNYYQYGEGSFVGPTFPRYFHANVTTLSLIYAF